MGEIKKINNQYYIEFFARGLKYHQLAGDTLDEAERLLIEVEEKIAKGEMSIVVRDIEVSVFLNDFLEYAQGCHTIKSLDRYRSVVNHFENFLNEKFPKLKNLSEVTPVVMEQYKDFLINDQRKPKPSLINFTLILMRDVLEYARKLLYLNDNPTLHVKLVEQKVQRTPDYLTEQEIKDLFIHVSEDVKDVLTIILHTGLNVQEVADLAWDEIDWEANMLRLNRHDKIQREIPVASQVREILEKLNAKTNDKESRVFYNQKNVAEQIRQELKSAAEVANLKKDVKAAIFRYTFVYRLLLKNFSLVRLYQFLGLSDVAKMMFYLPFLIQGKDDVFTSSPFSV